MLVYDGENHWIMKWINGATTGIRVDSGQGSDESSLSVTFHVAEEFIAGGNEDGTAMNQLRAPEGIFVDRHGHLYGAGAGNDRIQRFSRMN